MAWNHLDDPSAPPRQNCGRRQPSSESNRSPWKRNSWKLSETHIEDALFVSFLIVFVHDLSWSVNLPRYDTHSKITIDSSAVNLSQHSMLHHYCWMECEGVHQKISKGIVKAVNDHMAWTPMSSLLQARTIRIRLQKMKSATDGHLEMISSVTFKTHLLWYWMRCSSPLSIKYTCTYHDICDVPYHDSAFIFTIWVSDTPNMDCTKRL